MAARKDHRGRALRKGEIQRKDGTYAYVYTDTSGKRNTVYAKSLAELREKEDKLTKDQLDGLDVYSANSVTLNAVFDRYISTKYSLRVTTRANYNYMYDRFVRNGFGERKIASIKYSDVLSFYQKLLRVDHLKTATIEIIHCILHPTFGLAVRDEIIRRNPSDGVMGDVKKSIKPDAKPRHALTIEQQRTILDYCRNSSFEKWATLMTVLLGTGCRIGEVIGLTWKDIDLDKRLISINHSISYYMAEEDGKTVTRFRLADPKTASGIRVIPMMDAVYDAFVTELENQKKTGFCKAEVDGLTGFIFQNSAGLLHSGRTINRMIERMVKGCNEAEAERAKREKREPVVVPVFSCHILRHTFCTRFCENETNVKVIQSVMGHANIQTTMNIYAETHVEKKIAAITQLSKTVNVF